MRHFVTASIVVVVACLVISNCYAEALYDGNNGNNWNRASQQDKIEYCKRMADRWKGSSNPTSDYKFWLRNFDKVYDIDYSVIVTDADQERLGLTLERASFIVYNAYKENEKKRYKFGE